MPILLVPVDYYDVEKGSKKMVTNLGELLPSGPGPKDLETPS